MWNFFNAKIKVIFMFRISNTRNTQKLRLQYQIPGTPKSYAYSFKYLEHQKVTLTVSNTWNLLLCV
jgi:hypothetical protein